MHANNLAGPDAKANLEEFLAFDRPPFSYSQSYVICRGVGLYPRFPSAPRKGDKDPWMKVPPEQLSVRLGSDPSGAMEQSIMSKPWEQMSTSGGLATVRAVTRVNPEQASKVKSRRPTRLGNGEGRRAAGKQPMQAPVALRRGNGDGTCRRPLSQRGRPGPMRGRGPQRRLGRRSVRESDGPIVPRKPGNAGGGKGSDFGALSKRPKMRRLA